MIGPCARRVVTCTIIATDGTRVVGTNWCADAQPVCPRIGNEGYEKCQTICKQAGHAEEVAVDRAGLKAVGAHAYVENHTYACRNCQETLFAAGVAALTIGPPPPENV